MRHFAVLACGFAVLAGAVPARAGTTTLQRFSFSLLPRGVTPSAVVYDPAARVIYGVTHQGGTASSFGTVFSLAAPTVAGGRWTYTRLYAFTGGDTGAYPAPTLARDTAGRLWGATSLGGTYGNGMVWVLTPPNAAHAAWRFAFVYAFKGGTDGATPVALAVSGRTVLGITSGGGNSGSGLTNDGHGTVFSLYPVTGGGWRERVLYGFNGAHDPATPTALLISGLSILGTSQFTTDGGQGAVWRLVATAGTPTGYAAQVLHRFGGSPDGSFPQNLMLMANGSLVGTTYYGGSAQLGTVFQVVTGATPSYRVLYDFTSTPDAPQHPNALALGTGGTLVGTSFGGGKAGYGTAFSLTVPVSGSGALSVLTNFNASAGLGALPTRVVGTPVGYFGVTSSGASGAAGVPAADGGTVFQLVP